VDWLTDKGKTPPKLYTERKAANLYYNDRYRKLLRKARTRLDLEIKDKKQFFSLRKVQNHIKSKLSEVIQTNKLSIEHINIENKTAFKSSILLPVIKKKQAKALAMKGDLPLNLTKEQFTSKVVKNLPINITIEQQKLVLLFMRFSKE